MNYIDKETKAQRGKVTYLEQVIDLVEMDLERDMLYKLDCAFNSLGRC